MPRIDLQHIRGLAELIFSCQGPTFGFREGFEGRDVGGDARGLVAVLGDGLHEEGELGGEVEVEFAAAGEEAVAG